MYANLVVCLMQTLCQNIFSYVFHEILDANAVEKMDFSDEIEWDTKTLASVVKGYFA